MSKAENSQRHGPAGQLRKDIGQTVQNLQHLTHAFAKIDASLTESDAIRAKQSQYLEKMSKLQQENSSLRDLCQRLEEQSQKEIISYADINLKLTREFEARLKQKDQDRESDLEGLKRGKAYEEHTLRRELDSQKSELDRLKESENASRNRLEVEFKGQRDSWKACEVLLKNKLKELESQVMGLSSKKQELARDLQEHQIMLKGQVTESSRLRNSLATLEAFPPEPSNGIQSVITKLQSGFHEVCVLCVESTASFPGWRPIPKQLRYSGLPRNYSTQSTAGRFILAAAIQHSAWAAMAEDVFASYGLQNCQGLFRVADALHRKNQSREAVWRVLTTNAVLGDRELLGSFRNHLNDITHRLVKSWELFHDEQQADAFQTRLSELFYDHSMAWLSLLKLRKRISLSFRWDERQFETDSGEDSVQVPGNFVQREPVAPILFLSPAFLQDGTDGRTNLPIVLQKGKVLMESSPLLRVALKEEQEVSSLKMPNKTLNSWVGKGAVN